MLGGMKLSSSAAALRLSGLQGVDGKGKSGSERGHGLTRLVDSVRVPKGLAAGFFSRRL